MIISEFAGAAQSLNGSIVVNPWDVQEVANALNEAVTMDMETRTLKHTNLFKVCLPSWTELKLELTRPQYVQKYSAAYWGTSFVKELGKLKLGNPTLVLEEEAAQKKKDIANQIKE
jgi:trehalose 6-phosphate synthase